MFNKITYSLEAKSNITVVADYTSLVLLCKSTLRLGALEDSILLLKALFGLISHDVDVVETIESVEVYGFQENSFLASLLGCCRWSHYLCGVCMSAS